jgi:hypothetical protein
MSNSTIKIVLGRVHLEPIGGKVKVEMSLQEQAEEKGSGGNFIVWVDPSDSIEEINKRAMAESKRLFTRAGSIGES